MEDQNTKKRVRDDSGNSDLDSPEVKRLRDDLLGFLDDSDPDPTVQDLDSVMKSFAEEISPVSSSPVHVVDLTSDSGESCPDLGFLLEASDDELGLPPSKPSSTSQEEKEELSELVRVAFESSGVGELWGFEDQMSSFESFELGTSDGYNINTEYLAFDGLFEFADRVYTE